MEDKKHVISPLDEFTDAVLEAKAKALGITPEALIRQIVTSRLNGIASHADHPFFDCHRFSKNLTH